MATIRVEVDGAGDIAIKKDDEYKLFVELENLQRLIDDLKDAKPIAKGIAKSDILEQIAIEQAKLAEIQLNISNLQIQANTL